MISISDISVGDTIWVDPRDARIPCAVERRVVDTGSLVVGGDVVIDDRGAVWKLTECGFSWWTSWDDSVAGMRAINSAQTRALLDRCFP